MATEHKQRKAVATLGPRRLRRVYVLAAQAGGVLVGICTIAGMAVAWKSIPLGAGACLAGLGCLALAAIVVHRVFRWNAQTWVWQYLVQKRESFDSSRPLDVCFFFVDHFEPDWNSAPEGKQVERVERWQWEYERAVGGHADSDGCPPRHTWFAPVASIAPAAMSVLATWPARGWGEIEYHLHHDPHMNEAEIGDQIRADVRTLQRYGAIPTGRYGFVHGMSALAAGDPQYCNAPGEIDVLMETGCYADYTFGAIDTPAQPRQVNSVYYASSNGKPKSHDTGPPAEVGGARRGLLMIPGPMWFGLSRRVLDDAEVCPSYPPSPRRIARWLAAHVHVKGRPNWLLVGVHSHSAEDSTLDFLFSGKLQGLWSSLEERFKNGRARLHYVTAREVYNIVRAAEAGLDGNPHDYRDYEIPRPVAIASGSGPGTKAAAGDTILSPHSQRNAQPAQADEADVQTR